MSLLLRAITTTPTADVDGPLVRVAVGDLTAWATPSREEPVTREDALRHHSLVSAIFEAVEACLPARFPTLVTDEEALRTQMETVAEALTRQLEVVRGAAELAVTAVWVAPEEAPPQAAEATTPGRRYLLRRQAELSGSARRRNRASELADALERDSGGVLRAAERHVCPSTNVALSLALLVDRASADELKRRIGAQSGQDVRILVHGPWPPYTFVGRARNAEA